MSGKAKSVIVVGAGVWGLACALACARRGHTVTVLDTATPGSGASGGIVGAMAPHTPDQWNAKKAFQFDALATASDFWSTIERQTGQATGYGRIGRWQPLLTEDARTRAIARAAEARTNWRGAFGWHIIDRPPALPAATAPFGVIHDTLSARIHPARATAALAVACQMDGVTIRPHTPVTVLTENGVETARGPMQADATILAAGSAGFDLLAPFTAKSPGSAQKGQAALLDAPLPDLPQLYADGLYIVPHADGTTAIGSTSENSFTHPTATDDQLETLVARATALLPALTSAQVIQRWAGLRPKPRRRDPMLGPIPGLPNHFAALGAFKIGFGLAHKVGDTLADCLDGTPSIPESFSVPHHTG